MTRRATVKLRLYAGLVTGLLFVSVTVGRPELVALAAPFALALILGLSDPRPPALTARLGLERDRVLEGEPVEVTVELSASTNVARVEVAVGLSEWLTTTDGQTVRAVALSAGETRTVRFQLAAARWGAESVGPVAVRTHDLAGLHAFEAVAGDRSPLRVYPRPETLRRLVAPAETQAFTGNRPARERGEGIEFAELRPFVAGDRVREINWRIAARGGGLWVTERHPERNSDVVVFLDIFSDTMLDRAVRAAASLLAEYSRERDRVGLVAFGGSLRWVQPGTGLGHLYRVTEALIDTQVVVSYAWRGLETVPARTLPPKALVLALSPLTDERSVAALADLRCRGIDLAIVELAPSPPAKRRTSNVDRLGDRVWALDCEARRIRLRRIGIPVVPWTDQPLASVVEEVTAFRRRARQRVG